MHGMHHASFSMFFTCTRRGVRDAGTGLPHPCEEASKLAGCLLAWNRNKWNPPRDGYTVACMMVRLENVKTLPSSYFGKRYVEEALPSPIRRLETFSLQLSELAIHMKFDLFSIVTACSLIHTTLGFKSRFPPQITFSRSSNLACLQANPADDDILQIAVDDDEDDDDFMAMQREMAETIISSTNLPDSSSSIQPATQPSGVRNYNNYIAVASAVLGSFFFAFQHSQPVSGISLMHAMERDSVELQVIRIQIFSAFLRYFRRTFYRNIVDLGQNNTQHNSLEIKIFDTT